MWRELLAMGAVGVVFLLFGNFDIPPSVSLRILKLGEPKSTQPQLPNEVSRQRGAAGRHRACRRGLALTL